MRPATAADLETIVEFTQNLASETEGVTLPDDAVRRGVAYGLPELAAGRGGGGGLRPLYWVCEDAASGNPCGMVGVSPEWSDWWGCEYWWVIAVYVLPPARRQRCAQGMLRRLLALARDGGVQTVNLRVERLNASAQALYTASGFAVDESHLVMACGRTPAGDAVGAGFPAVRGD